MSVSIRIDRPHGGSVSVDVADRIMVVDVTRQREVQADEVVRAVEMASAALGLSVFYIAEQLEKRART